MIVNSKDILLNAKRGKYSVPAPDFVDLDSARTFVNVAERLNKPIILSYAEAFKDFLSLEEALVIGRCVANSVKVPICLHLDHGTDFEVIKKAIEIGFTSVMIDASTKSFDENVRITKEVIAIAKKSNVTVEAEIGHVGQAGGNAGGECSEGDADSIYTSVEEAKEFAERTNVDSLAISIGTAHGIYKGLKTPELNFTRLAEIEKAVSIPLVLHGGSGSGDENLHKCATCGISKINIYTDFLIGAFNEINSTKPSNYLDLKAAANKGMEQTLQHYFKVFAND